MEQINNNTPIENINTSETELFIGKTKEESMQILKESKKSFWKKMKYFYYSILRTKEARKVFMKALGDQELNPEK